MSSAILVTNVRCVIRATRGICATCVTFATLEINATRETCVTQETDGSYETDAMVDSQSIKRILTPILARRIL